MPRTSLSKLRDEALAEKQALIESGEYVPEEDEGDAEVATSKVKKQDKKPGKKSFKDTDMIRCVSVTTGKLIMEGLKSNDKYVWEAMNDVVDVEYRDLIAAVKKHSKLVFKPRFIIQDKDFLEQNPEIEKLYGSLYTADDIDQVLDLPADRMREYILQMPAGAKDALLGIAVTKIDRGILDSVQRIKVIDEIFGTQLLLKVTQ